MVRPNQDEAPMEPKKKKRRGGNDVCSLGPRSRFSKVPVTFRARRAVLSVFRVCIQNQSINNLKNDKMKLSVNEVKLRTGW